ncbi:MAG: DNA repair protein RecO [Myxococcales bacterium]|nr:DNA repair protein RecO [Myxococcales bacterium]
MPGAVPVQRQALLLRSVDFRDRDRILTLLTREQGKLSAIARGARGSRRRFVGLEPFCVLDIELAQGRGDLHRLQSSTVRRAFPELLRSLDGITRAGQAVELVRDLTVPLQAEPELFDLLVLFFESIGADGGCEVTLLEMKARALAIAGLFPSLNHCALCRRPAPEARPALFDPRSDGIVCRACGGGSLRLGAATRASLRALFGRRPFAQQPFAEAEAPEVRELLRALGDRHLRRR